MPLILWAFAFIGHVGLWCATFNYLHSTALVRWARKGSEMLVLAFLVFPALFLGWQMLGWLGGWTGSITLVGDHAAGRIYSFIALALSVPTLAMWGYRKLTLGRPESVVEFSQTKRQLSAEYDDQLMHGRVARLLGWLPINESLTLAVDRVTIQRELPAALHGLKIAHVSDFHLTGRVDRRFFERVVEEANRFEPDLVIISGDLVDKVACLDWIESIFGSLNAKFGCFYVLGNHDARVGDVDALRRQLSDAGLVHLGGRWHSVEVNGARVELAGNELPWFSGAERLPRSADASSSELGAQADLKILVSHSPDQLEWAKPFQFDLMFAGHNHGGQISFPVVGPIIAPSKYGVRYAAGTFEIGSMLLHVSRGLSGEKPIRWNSPPELGLFTVHAVEKLAAEASR